MKQIKKLSLSNAIGKLTRNEMRYVMAGSGNGHMGYPSFDVCVVMTLCYSQPGYSCIYYGGGWICSHP